VDPYWYTVCVDWKNVAFKYFDKESKGNIKKRLKKRLSQKLIFNSLFGRIQDTEIFI